MKAENYSLTQKMVTQMLLIMAIMIGTHVKAQFTVTGSTGQDGNYTSLTNTGGVFAALNAASQSTKNIVVTVTASSTSETGNNSLTGAAGMWTSLRIVPVGGAWEISGSKSGFAAVAGAIINFAGATDVTIDGINSGGVSLTIANTYSTFQSLSSGPCAIRFTSSAQRITITNCNLQSSANFQNAAYEGGTVVFSGAGAASNPITITNCNIGPYGSNLPVVAINSYNTVNTNITISNNNIFDYYCTASYGISYGIGLTGASSTSWTINGNRFYQTAVRNGIFWSGNHIPIFVGATLTACTITNNIIGFANASQTGTYDIRGDGTASATGKFVGISVSGTGTTNVNNNTIQNISVSSVQSNGAGVSTPFAGIMLASSATYTTNNNIIGSLTANGSLTYTKTTNTTATEVHGISKLGGNGTSWTANGNRIGGFTLGYGASTNGAIQFFGMRCLLAAAGGTFTANSNIIGGSVANSIQINNSSATGSRIVGIMSDNSSNNGGTANNLRANTISNFTLSSTSQPSGNGTAANLAGIIVNNTGAQNIRNNTIYNLNCANTSSFNSWSLYGIHAGVNTNSTIDGNFIYNLTSAHASNGAANISGIYIVAVGTPTGTNTFSNNMISFPQNQAARVIPIGIYNAMVDVAATWNFYHNSVYIGGTTSGGVPTTPVSSAAYYSTMNTATALGTEIIQNNIFQNERTGGTSAVHVIINIGANTSRTTLNNNIYSRAAGVSPAGFQARVATTGYTTFATWKSTGVVSTTGADAASIEGAPTFKAPTATTPDLHITYNATSWIGNAAGADLSATVSTDFDGLTRSGFTAHDIGAAVWIAGASPDVTDPTITYTPITSPQTCGTQPISLTVSPISDAGSGIEISGLAAPIMYYKINSGSYNAVPLEWTSGTAFKVTFPAVPAYVAGDAISYYIMAQDGSWLTSNVQIGPNQTGAATFTVNPPAVGTPPTTPSSFSINSVTVNAGTDKNAISDPAPAAITLSGATVSSGNAKWAIVSLTPANTNPGTLSSYAEGATPATVTYTPPPSYAGTVVLRLIATTTAVGACTFTDDVNIVIASGASPEMDVAGNSNSITDGDATPSATDHTDFGNATIGVSTVVRTFTISNSGTGALSLSGTPIVAVSGTNAADFSVTSQPSSSSIAASGSLTFQVTFNPSATGNRSATISIANDDSNENPYDFAIQGTGLAAVPEINITGNSNSIVDGDITPSATDHTDFGSANVTGGTVVRTFTIQNTGTATLNISGYNITGTNSGDFSITTNPSATVAAGGNTTIGVTFDPSAFGTRSATLNITNDDADEGTYDFAIQGTGSCAAPGTAASIGAYTNNVSPGTSITVNWSRGTGDGVIVVGRLTATAAVAPTNGTSYTTTSFGSGSGNQLTGAGNFVLYNGTATSLNVSGLTSAVDYTFTVYEYNTTDNCYAAGSGQAVTTWAPCTPPGTQASIGAYTNNTTGNSITVNWTRGNGTAGVIVVARLTSTADVEPSIGSSYSANTAFGSGNTTGTGNFVVYNGSAANTVNVSNLTAGASYTFTVYEYNTTGTCYKTPGSSSAVCIVQTPGSITGSTTPCLSAQAYSIASVTGATGYTWSVSGGGSVTSGQGTNSTTITWTSGGAQTVSVTADFACGSSSAQNLAVTVTGSSAPIITFDAGSIVNIGCEMSFSITPVSASAGTCISYTANTDYSGSYSFSQVGNCSWAGSVCNGCYTTIRLFIDPLSGSNTTTGNFNVTVSNGTCSTTVPITINSRVNLTSSGTIASADQSICEGDDPNSITVTGASVSPSSAITYQWYYKVGSVANPSGNYTTIQTGSWIAIGGATAATYDPAIGEVATGTTRTYACFVIPAGSVYCGKWASGTRKITINALPAAPTGTITPAANPACGSTTLSHSAGGTTFYWQTSATGTSTGQNTTTAYNLSSPGGTIYARTYNGTCWSSGTINSGAVTVNANPTATISGSLTGCVSPGVALGTTGSAAGSGSISGYQWKLSGVDISGATSSTYTASASGSYTVVVTNSNNCSTTSSASVVVANANPTATISGTLTGCVSPGVSLGTTGSAAGSGSITGYQWKLAGSDITGATSSTYTATASGSYTVVVTNSNNCSTTSSASSVTANANPTATISGSLTGCVSPGVALSATSSTPGSGTISGYQWKLAGSDISGATSSTYTAATSGSYTVVVTNSNNCSTTSAASVVVANANPTASPAFASNPICSGNSTLLSANATAGSGTITTYVWSSGIAGNNASGNVSTAGTYTVTVLNSNGCSVESTTSALVVNSIPSAPTGSASQTFCSAASPTVASLAATGSTIKWYATSSGGAALSTSDALSNAATYHASQTVSGCESSDRLAVTATLSANLSAVSLSPSGAQSFSVSASGTQLTASETGGGTVTRQWGWRSISGGAITNIGGQTGSTYTPAAADLNSNSAGTYYVVCTSTPQCGSPTVSNEVTVTVNALAGKVWTGSVSKAWDIPGNWNPSGVPTATDDVTIPHVPNDPSMGTNGTARNFTMQPGAILTVGAGYALTLTGNYTGNTNTIFGSGTVLFAGTSAQTITGATTWPKLQVNNSNGVSVVSGMQTITLALKLQSGVFTTNGNLTLASDATNTGLIDDFSGGYTGSISGNVTVKRYFGGGYGYRYISSPISSAANLQVTNFSGDITGLNNYIYNPLAPPPAGSFPTCYIYNENDANAVESTNAGNGWVSKTSGAIETLRGYAAILNPQTISLTGSVNTGAKSINITYTSSGNSNADGYNLVGNPYPSPIGWNAIRTAVGETNLSANVKRWSSSGSYYGNYNDWNGSVGTNGATNTIALGQAFFIKTTSNCSSCSFGLTNSVRVDDPSTAFYEEGTPTIDNSLLRLKISTENGADEAVVYFDEKADDSYESRHDADKMLAFLPGIPNLYTRAADSKLSINVLGKFDSDKIVPLDIKAGASGIHKLDVMELINFDESAGVYLEDRLNGSFQNLRDVSSFNLNLNQGTTSDRFFIHFKKDGSTGISALSRAGDFISIRPNPAADVVTLTFSQGFVPATMRIYDAVGREVETVTGSAFSVRGLPNGIYHIAITGKEGRFVMPFVVAH